MLRKLVLIFVLADNFIMNMLKKPFGTKWKLEGKCKKCGKCCQNIGMEINPKLLKSRFTTWIVVKWTCWLFNFYLKSIENDRRLLIFGCNSTNSDGTCGDYKWRPNICRNYPLKDYFDKPALFDTCGFKAVLKK